MIKTKSIENERYFKTSNFDANLPQNLGCWIYVKQKCTFLPKLGFILQIVTKSFYFLIVEKSKITFIVKIEIY